MFSNDIQKLIDDAIAVNVQLRDRLSGMLAVQITQRPAEVARDYLTVTIGVGMRAGKTSAMLHSVKNGDLIVVPRVCLVADIAPAIIDLHDSGMDVAIASSVRLAEEPGAFKKYTRIWLSDSDMLNEAGLLSVYKNTAESITQTWIRLV